MQKGSTKVHKLRGQTETIKKDSKIIGR